MAWAEGGRLWKGWIDRGREGALGGSVREYNPPPEALCGARGRAVQAICCRCEKSNPNQGPFLHAVLTSRATRGRTGR